MIDQSRQPLLDQARAPADEVGLPPHRTAALVAPAIDRIVLGALAAGRARGAADLSRRYGGPAATGYLVIFRTRLAAPGGTVSGSGLAAVTRYQDPVTSQRKLDKQVAHGMLQRVDTGFTATDRGRAFLVDLHELYGRLTAELWSGHHDRIGRLADLLGRLLTAAVQTEAGGVGPGRSRHDPTDPGPPGAGRTGPGPAGSAFAAMAPPYEPDGTPPALTLLNRLGTLRYHRADAHAAAWTAAGHTADSIADLDPGPERLAIELETDRRAAGPYTALSAAERLALLADLAALPG
nr:hypothetical protein [Micromonospora sp. DSM 115978]